jgi:uncharacterized protein
MCEPVEIKGSPIADPGPLGLTGFALTTFCLSSINAGFIGKESIGIVIALAIVYGGIAQMLAGMWEFKKNNLFGATAFTSYGAFWISFAIFELGNIYQWFHIPPEGVLLFLIAWTIFTFYMWIGSFALNKALVTVFSALLVTFILLDFGVANHEMHVIGGYFGLLTAFAAWYTSAAGILNTVYGRVVLPVGPLGNSGH